VRCGDDFLVCEQGLIEVWGFGVEDIDCQATEPIVFESLPNGVVIDQAASRGIDQDGMIGHAVDGRLVDEVLRGVGEWAVKRDDVRGSQQVFDREHGAIGPVVVA